MVCIARFETSVGNIFLHKINTFTTLFRIINSTQKPHVYDKKWLFIWQNIWHSHRENVNQAESKLLTQTWCLKINLYCWYFNQKCEIGKPFILGVTWTRFNSTRNLLGICFGFGSTYFCTHLHTIQGNPTIGARVGFCCNLYAEREQELKIKPKYLTSLAVFIFRKRGWMGRGLLTTRRIFNKVIFPFHQPSDCGYASSR